MLNELISSFYSWSWDIQVAWKNILFNNWGVLVLLSFISVNILYRLNDEDGPVGRVGLGILITGLGSLLLLGLPIILSVALPFLLTFFLSAGLTKYIKWVMREKDQVRY